MACELVIWGRLAVLGGLAALAALGSPLSRGAATATPSPSPVIAFISGSELVVARVDGSGARVVVPNAGRDFPSWNSSSDRVAIGSRAGLWSVRPDGTDRRQVTTLGAAFPTWSPSGDRLTFARWADDHVRVHVVAADGSDDQTITGGPCPAYPFPLWSPIADQIAYAEVCNGSGDGMGSVRSDGTGYRKLTARSNGRSAWSRDGQRLAFLALPGIGIVNADGSGEHTIIADVTAWNPEWSPDGTRFVFPRWDGTQTDLYVVNADGTHLRALTSTTDADESWGTWSPDASTIAYQLDQGDHHEVRVVASSGGESRRLTSGRAPDEWYPVFAPTEVALADVSPPPATSTTSSAAITTTTTTAAPSKSAPTAGPPAEQPGSAAAATARRPPIRSSPSALGTQAELNLGVTASAPLASGDATGAELPHTVNSSAPPPPTSRERAAGPLRERGVPGPRRLAIAAIPVTGILSAAAIGLIRRRRSRTDPTD